MISPAYCVTMARYARWQNRQIVAAVAELELALEPGRKRRELSANLPRLALLCARALRQDHLWLRRLDALSVPNLDVPLGDDHIGDWDSWRRDRQQLDARLVDWAQRQTSVMLEGELFWYSAQDARAMSRPVWQCVSHLFTEQSTLRGAIAMQLALMGQPIDAGDPLGAGDLLQMPQDVDWM